MKHNIITDRNRASAALRACVKTLKMHSGNKEIKEIIFTYKLFSVIIWCREKIAAVIVIKPTQLTGISVSPVTSFAEKLLPSMK